MSTPTDVSRSAAPASYLAANIQQYRHENETIKEEVDRMYARILKSIESASSAPHTAELSSPISAVNAFTPDPVRVNHFLSDERFTGGSGGGGLFSSRGGSSPQPSGQPLGSTLDSHGIDASPTAPLVLNAANDSRIAAMRALLGGDGGTSHLFCRNTFGSGRKGMAAPCKKSDKGTPGPGAYNPYRHEEDPSEGDSVFAVVTKDSEVILLNSNRRAPSQGCRPASAMSRSQSAGALGMSVLTNRRPSTAAKPKKGFSFGKATRTSVLSVEEASLHTSSSRSPVVRPPGPGEYKPPSSFESASKPSSTKGSFGRAKRDATDPKHIAPGPGSYAIESSHMAAEGVRSFAVSSVQSDRTKQRGFSSSSPRIPPLRSQSPGPCAYDSEEVANRLAPAACGAGGHSFGKAQLETLKTHSSTGPGPGDYDVKTVEETGFQGPKGGIPSAGRDDAAWGVKEGSTMPGPGAYNPDLPKSDVGVSFKFRYRQKVDELPGPGAYETNPDTHEGPKWSLYGRPSEAKIEISPGPSDYNTVGNEREQHGRSVAMSKAEREMHPDETRSRKEAFPGPGHYHTESVRTDVGGVIGAAPKEDLSERRRADEAALSPGPGTYEPILGTLEGRSAILDSASPRFEVSPQAKALLPGPGYYDSVSMDVVAQAGLSGAAPRTVFGAEKRFLHSALQIQTATGEHVGPGSYAIVPLGSGICTSIGLPLSQKVDDPTDGEVGPGRYNAEVARDLTLPRAPVAVFPTSSRIVTEKASDVPGPGAYDSNYSNILPEPPNAIITNAPRQRQDETRAMEEAASRGPGTYDPNDANEIVAPSIAIGNASRFGDRERSLAEVALAPGPGTYNSSIQRAGPHAIISTSGPGHQGLDLATASPGPAAYDVIGASQTIEGRGTVVSFGSAPQRVTAANADVPGPGAYTQNPSAVDPHIPGPVINGRPSPSSEERGNPMVGPGTYDPAEVAKHPHLVSFGSAGRVFDQVMSKDVPGPGWYAVERKAIDLKGYEAFMAKSRRFVDAGDEEQAQLPGPGYYAHTDRMIGSNDHSAPSFGRYAGRPEQHNDASHVPGPGAYHTSETLLKSAAITIHALDRFIAGDFVTKNSTTPGPGTYDIATTIGANQQSAPTLSSRVATSDRSGAVLGTAHSTGPGPGAYDPYLAMRKLAESSPVYSFGIAAKYGLPDPRAHFPGPGAYSLPDITAAGRNAFSFGKDRKDQQISDDAVPGPGTYDLILPTPSPAFSFGQADRNSNDPRSLIPGPGAYNVDLALQSQLPNGHAFSFGSAAQRTLLANPQNSVPGPGAYNQSIPGSEGVAYSFPVAPKYERETQKTPGPGAYNSELKPEGPFYSIAGKYPENEKESESVPGPGAYEQAANRSAPTVTIGNAQRFPFESGADAPGPGAYSLSLPSAGPAISFGLAPRSQGEHINDAPGPGMYTVQYQKDGPVFTFPMAPTGRNVTTEESSTPGPGAYAAFASWGAAASGFTQAERFPAPTDMGVPGPGQYLHFPMWNSNHAPSFTTAESETNRQLREAASMPGPGQYTSQLSPQGPFFSMYGKYPDSFGANDFFPGPGSYDTSQRPDLPTAPSATIPRASRVDPDEASRAAVPGPGMYRLPGTLSPLGPKFSTAAKFVGAPQDFVPGPGAYLQPDTLGGPKWTFPTSERHDADLHMDVPGPGMYDGGRGKDATMRRPADFTIPRSERQGIVDSNQGSGVGPGQYNLGSAPHAGPAYSIPEAAAHASLKTGLDNPGPGQYFGGNNWNNGKGPSIAGKWKPNSGEATPGPGAYRTHDYDPYKRDMATVIDFSKGGQRVLHPVVSTQSGGPSPGDYYNAGTFGDGKGVSILNRFATPFSEPTPGPPDYHSPNVQNPFYDPLAR